MDAYTKGRESGVSGKGRRCPVDGMLDGGKGVRDWTGLGERREGVLVTGLGGRKVYW